MNTKQRVQHFAQTHWKTILTAMNCLLVAYVLYLVFLSGEFNPTKNLKSFTPFKQNSKTPDFPRIDDIVSASSYTDAMQFLRNLKVADAGELKLLIEYLRKRQYLEYEIDMIEEYNLLNHALSHLLYTEFHEAHPTAFLLQEAGNLKSHRLVQDLFLQAWLIHVKHEALQETPKISSADIYQDYLTLTRGWDTEKQLYHRKSLVVFLLDITKAFPESLWQAELKAQLDQISKNPVLEEVAATAVLNYFSRDPMPLGRTFAGFCLQQKLNPLLMQQAIRTYQICSTDSDVPLDYADIVILDAPTELMIQQHLVH